MNPFWSLLLIVLPSNCVAFSWTTKPSLQASTRHSFNLKKFLGAQFATDSNHVIDSASEPGVMEGVAVFEKWFGGIGGAECIPEVSHMDFGNLRGLSLASEASNNLKASGELKSIMKVPKSVVLSSDFSQPDWDAKLAQQLWIEATKGPTSSISGYVSLLTRGWSPSDLPELPPSTAPDSLRHWTEKEKDLLQQNHAGQRLLDLLDRQNQLWKRKFVNINGMTYDQFQWAMEVVHSRAFCGDFGAGGSFLPPVVNLAVPAVAAVTGFMYYYQNPDPSDALMIGLAGIATIPSVLSVLQDNPLMAVLLPMIDSINHREEADSSIEYSPLSDTFSLSIGENCASTDESGKVQLFVSYGKKKDTELLLNYGFLRDVSVEGDESLRRKALAEKFLAKNS